MDFLRAADLTEIPPGGRKSLVIDDAPALLLRAGDTYYCVEDVCTHDGQPLTDGPFHDGCITCPRHGARFRVDTGAPQCMPATEAIRTFAVDVRADGVYVSLSPKRH